MTLKADTISRLQSDTFKASLRGLVLNAAALVAIVLGVAVDTDKLESYMNLAFLALPMVYNLWEFKNAMKGRVKAEKKIEPLPWKDELKQLRGKQ